MESLTGQASETGGTRPLLGRSALLHVVEGVAVATKITDEQLSKARLWITSSETEDNDQEVETSNATTDSANSLKDSPWYEKAVTLRGQQSNNDYWPVIYLTIAVTYLREISRRSLHANIASLEATWDLIHRALTDRENVVGYATRSAQGCLAVPLHSIVQNDNLQELFRLLLWLPDGQRVDPNYAIHSQQPFAQAWVLAGTATDKLYDKQLADASQATHAEFALTWTGTEGRNDDKYKTHSVSSTITNTHRWVSVKLTDILVRRQDESYTLTPSEFHASTIEKDAMHATLHFFDSSQGFRKDAPILGPKDTESLTNVRDSAGATASRVAEITSIIRLIEQTIAKGQRLNAQGSYEPAVQALDDALALVEASDVPNKDFYRQSALEERKKIDRSRLR